MEMSVLRNGLLQRGIPGKPHRGGRVWFPGTCPCVHLSDPSENRYVVFGNLRFSGSRDVKALVRKVLTHPCIIACEIGIFLMLTQLPLPGMVQSTINSLAGCNTALSMMVVGMILADLKLREMVDVPVMVYSAVRLILIPVLVLIPCRLLGLDAMVTGVSVLLAAMPAGATTSILAAKYNADAGFATKMIIMSTLASVITTPIWSFILA